MTRPTTAATWQPIETAPRDGTFVVLWEGGWAPRALVGYYDAEDERPTWRDHDGGIIDFLREPITHWLPLPPPPEGADGQS